jgi:hypothetical protein
VAQARELVEQKQHLMRALGRVRVRATG